VSKKPLIIAHRGDRKKGIENTIDACEKALAAGANALEIDIRQTGTGEIVVFHDFSLKRMFNKPGYIGRTPFDKLKTYPYTLSPRIQPSQYLETLDQFLEQFKNRIPINLDAKTIHFFDVNFAEKIINTIKNHRLIDSIWISCFNPFLLQILKLKERKIRTGYLFQRLTPIHTLYDLITWSDAWHPHHRVVTEGFVKKAKKYSKQVYVWTVNDKEVLRKISKFEIDGVISDEVKIVKGDLYAK
jgi:glycerophosphoryl diester phosphodiesterase